VKAISAATTLPRICVKTLVLLVTILGSTNLNPLLLLVLFSLPRD